MTDAKRNAIIGLFVLGALVGLGILIVKFGEEKWLFHDAYLIKAKFTIVSGIRPGTEVRLAGVAVGRVVDVALASPENPTEGAIADMEIRSQFSIPVGWTAHVETPLMGQPVINILPPTGLIPGPTPAPQVEFQPRNGTGLVLGQLSNPLADIIDPEFMATLEKTTSQIGVLAQELTPAAQAITQLLEKRTIAEVDAPNKPEEVTATLYTAVEQLRSVLKHMDTIMGDAENQGNIKASLANFRAASEEAKLAAAGLKQFTDKAQAATTQASTVLENLDSTVTTTHQRIDALGSELLVTTEKLSRIMDHGLTVMQDMSEGNGTVGLLLRDPKFYEELLLTTQRLGTAANELTVLIKQWQETGLMGSL